MKSEELCPEPEKSELNSFASLEATLSSCEPLRATNSAHISEVATNSESLIYEPETLRHASGLKGRFILTNERLRTIQGEITANVRTKGEGQEKEGTSNCGVWVGLSDNEIAVFKCFFFERRTLVEIVDLLMLPLNEALALKKSSKQKVLRAFRELKSLQNEAVVSNKPSLDE